MQQHQHAIRLTATRGWSGTFPTPKVYLHGETFRTEAAAQSCADFLVRESRFGGLSAELVPNPEFSHETTESVCS